MAGSMLHFSIEILQLSSLYHSYPLFYLNKARVAGGNQARMGHVLFICHVGRIGKMPVES